MSSLNNKYKQRDVTYIDWIYGNFHKTEKKKELNKIKQSC